MKKREIMPWLLLPGVVLTLSGVSLLVPRQPAQAASPAHTAAPKAAAPNADAYNDGDGDELLEHWGDPKYSLEERKQIAGIAAGFCVLGTVAYRRRIGRRSRCEIVRMPTEADFLKLDSRKAA